jgi:hypothetical protein
MEQEVQKDWSVFSSSQEFALGDHSQQLNSKRLAGRGHLPTCPDSERVLTQ